MSPPHQKIREKTLSGRVWTDLAQTKLSTRAIEINETLLAHLKHHKKILQRELMQRRGWLVPIFASP